MLIKNEKQLLNFIKYSPILIIFLIAILINIFIYRQNEQNLKKDLAIYEKNYIESNKKLTKFQVDKVYTDIQRKRASLEANIEKMLKHRVNNALNTVENLHKKYSHLPKKQIINLIKESLRTIRFNDNREYIYIIKTNGDILLHQNYSKNINIQNKSIIDHFKIHNEFLGYIKTSKPTDSSNKTYDKLTYLKKYEPLDIIIGTGDYKDSFTKDIQKYIIEEYIQNVQYDKNGYIFIFDYDGYQLAHVKKEYIGKQRIDLVDANGFMITKEIIKQAKKGYGFIEYIGSIMPETNKPAYKTTYVRGVDDWGWAIGSGFYNLDLIKYLKLKKEEIKKINSDYLRKTLIASFILTIILLTLALYISNILKRFFDKYHKKIKAEIQDNRKKDMLLYQQSKMASMGEMLGNIAHQWRQPLSTISTVASGSKIQKELNLLDDNTFHKSMDTILNTTRHLSQTIDDFREFFNPHKIKTKLSTKKLYEKSIQLISSRLTTKDIEIKADIDDIVLLSYKNELLQCIINILNNAIDAFDNKNIDKKLIEYKIKYTKECFIPNCDTQKCPQAKNGYVSIIIHDTAGGIPQDCMDKIFDVYFTTKHQSQGTGIGLYMTYEIITKHLNGFISGENKNIICNEKTYLGAQFKILLPIEIKG